LKNRTFTGEGWKGAMKSFGRLIDRVTLVDLLYVTSDTTHLWLLQELGILKMMQATKLYEIFITH